ncbi:Uncharacterized protein OBRU01_01043 [Operophtera brumata]|uniref:Uncharacterized protein n=1 Tax=Operophtera brumata TaxID=104452 RepID=A0A0L7LUN3_OPEBR|nr:Uncharacterized protein OBRU01_01043 [Operophtera brumata]
MMSTNVVLVTKQIVIGSAKEIDRLPKEDLRSRSRVVLGHRCNRGSSIRVRDYTFHPEYKEDTYSALAMVQLEIDNVEQDCKKGVVQIYKMIYVPMERCKQFYRKSGDSKV